MMVGSLPAGRFGKLHEGFFNFRVVLEFKWKMLFVDFKQEMHDAIGSIQIFLCLPVFYGTCQS